MTLLTDEIVRELPLRAGTSDTVYLDDELSGFGVRVRLDAKRKLKRSYMIQYRLDGGQRRMKVGDCNKLSLDQARKQAGKLLAKVTLGQDPSDEKKQKRKDEALKFEHAVKLYLAKKQTTIRASSFRITKLYLTGKQYFGPLHSQPLVKITQSMVATQLDQYSGPTFSRLRAHLNAFYVWALSRGHCKINPVAAIENEEPTASRTRVLSDDELRKVWETAGDTTLGKIIKLLLLTGCRRHEIGGLKWSEIDLDAKTITLPASRTKNKHEHVVPLVPMAVAIIRSIPKTRDHLFGERAERGYTSFQADKAALEDDCKPWRLHDLRRTVATKMADLGVLPHVIEAVLNHRTGRSGIAGVYNRASYAKEVSEALERWEARITEIRLARAA